MKKEEELFFQILEWASKNKKKEDGFLVDEIVKQFNLNEDQVIWLQRTFLGHIDGDIPLFGNLELSESYKVPDPRKKFLTASAISMLTDRSELEEVRKSSRNAQKLAMTSLWIAISVGILQITTQLFPEEIREFISCIFNL